MAFLYDSLNLPVYTNLQNEEYYLKKYFLSDGSTMIIQVKRKDECTFLIKLIGTDKTVNDISFIDLSPESKFLILNFTFLIKFF